MEQDAAGQELILNMDILEEQKGTVSTLGDLYGYNVFSEEFDRQVTNYQKKKEAAQEEAFQNVFYRSLSREEELERSFQAVMTAESQMVVREDYRDNRTQENNPWLMAGFILVGMFLTGSILFGIEKKRRGKRKHAANDNDYRTQYESI